MTDFLEKHGILSLDQFGFQKNKSTEMAVTKFCNYISKALDKSSCVISVFLDLQKAFDTVGHDILLKKLIYYGFCGKSLSLLKRYLTNRKQYIFVINRHYHSEHFFSRPISILVIH